jgi:uncharacterized DUF497 family protein
MYDYGSLVLARYDVLIDEGNEEHVTAHGVSLSEIAQVLWNDPVIRKNRKARSAEYIADGLTDGGSRVVIPFDVVDGAARPITAWRL